MFVWRVDVFLAELARQQPQLHAGLTADRRRPGTPRARDEVLGEVWPTLPKISVDYAVMEGAAAAGRVGTVPGDFGWNDVGDFHTLGEVLAADAGRQRGRRPGADGQAGRAAARDASGLVVVPQLRPAGRRPRASTT